MFVSCNSLFRLHFFIACMCITLSACKSGTTVTNTVNVPPAVVAGGVCNPVSQAEACGTSGGLSAHLHCDAGSKSWGAVEVCPAGSSCTAFAQGGALSYTCSSAGETDATGDSADADTAQDVAAGDAKDAKDSAIDVGEKDTGNPPDVAKDVVSAGAGSLTVKWTAFGQAAAAGCAKHAIGKVNVLVLAGDRTTQLGMTQAECTAGAVTLDNVGAGEAFVELDEANPLTGNAYGNIELMPVTIQAGKSATVAGIDLAQRSLLAVPYGFADGASCTTHAVAQVRFQISGNDTVIVPFSDGQMTKPCESTSNYADRVIDLANSPPTCAVPPGGVGVVLCNAGAIGKLTVAGQGLKTGGTIGFGGKVDFTGLKDGQFTQAKTPLALVACSGKDPLCQP